MTEGGPEPCPCRNVNADETDQTSEFLLPNYNNCKNSDTPLDGRRDTVQQNSLKKITARLDLGERGRCADPFRLSK
jgi:hypothetical protein